MPPTRSPPAPAPRPTRTTAAPAGTVAIPPGGGVPLTLATEQSYVQAIVLDASYVYWTTEDDATGKPPGSVLRVAK